MSSDENYGSSSDQDSDFEDDNCLIKKKTPEKKTKSSLAKKVSTKKGGTQSSDHKENLVKSVSKRSAPVITDPQFGPSLKKGKVSSVETEHLDVIRNYMLTQNRPYSHLNVFDNLHGIVKKTLVPKLLDKLVDEGSVQMKEYGKVKIFLAAQSSFPTIDPKELNDIECKMTDMAEHFGDLRIRNKSLVAELSDLKNQLTDANLIDEIALLELQCNQKQSKYTQKIGGALVLLSEDDFTNVKQKHTTYLKLWKQRKRFCADIIEAILGDGSKKKSDLEEEIGFENDAEAGVDPAGHSELSL